MRFQLIGILAILPSAAFAQLSFGGPPQTSNPPTPPFYYVDCASGNDSNPGTASQPVATISGADALATSASTIVIKRGQTCNFASSQNINHGERITSLASFYTSSSSDALPVLSGYGSITSTGGWTNVSGNVWRHTFGTTFNIAVNYVRFGALGIANAGVFGGSDMGLTGAKNYFNYNGTSTGDPAYVDVYATENPFTQYGNIYYSYNDVLVAVSAGGSGTLNGLRVDHVTFANVMSGVVVLPLDAVLSNVVIENINCVDVYLCVSFTGDGVAGNTMQNITMQNSTINGASGPGMQFGNVDRVLTSVVQGNNISGCGYSASYGCIYTVSWNAAASAHDTTYNGFKVQNNFLSNCISGSFFTTDGACIENDMGSLAVMMTGNTIFNSHYCYKSNSGGLSGYSTQAPQALVFTNNTCTNSDQLAQTSDGEGYGNAIVSILNNTTSNLLMNVWYPQNPNRTALVDIENNAAIKISINGNSINLISSWSGGTAYGIAANGLLTDGTNMCVASNTFSNNLTSNYVNLSGGNRTAMPC